MKTDVTPLAGGTQDSLPLATLTLSVYPFIYYLSYKYIVFFLITIHLLHYVSKFINNQHISAQHSEQN